MRTLPLLRRVRPAIDSRIVVLPAPEVPKIGLDRDLSAFHLQVDFEQ